MTSDESGSRVETTIVPQQIALIDDAQGCTLQTRFEQFASDAIDALTQSHPKSGEPLFEAGSVSSKMEITIEVVRQSNDSLSFEIIPTIKTKHPPVPGRSRAAVVVAGVGLAQRVRSDQGYLFRADEGQPKPISLDQAQRTIPKESKVDDAA